MAIHVTIDHSPEGERLPWAASLAVDDTLTNAVGFGNTPFGALMAIMHSPEANSALTTHTA